MSKNKINTTEVAESLRKRVEQAIKTLNDIGFNRSPKYYFTLKYPKYSDINWLNNLWYGKSTDSDFADDLEKFVETKQIEYKKQ